MSSAEQHKKFVSLSAITNDDPAPSFIRVHLTASPANARSRSHNIADMNHELTLNNLTSSNGGEKMCRREAAWDDGVESQSSGEEVSLPKGSCRNADAVGDIRKNEWTAHTTTQTGRIDIPSSPI
jgi:hypothetical protein